MHPDSIGGFIVGVPALLIAYVLLWYRHRAVFWFAFALILVGVGYLVAVGAAADIATFFLGAAIA
jgi:hypothetical protein